MNQQIPAAVLHKVFGKGRVVKVEGNKMYISFGGTKRLFMYPDAFEKGFLQVAPDTDTYRQSSSSASRSSRNKATAITQIIPDAYSSSIEVTYNDQGIREAVLDADKHIAFHTIYEAINAMTGTNYTGWMKACWPNYRPDQRVQGFRIWFTKLKEIKDGKYVAAAFDCMNSLSDNWNEHVYDDLKKGWTEGNESYDGYDLIIAKEPNGGDYIFRGVYIADYEKSAPNHYVSKRIGKKVKLIGQPASKIIILDDFRIR